MKKQGIICVSNMCWGRNDLTSVRKVLLTAEFCIARRPRGVYLGAWRLLEHVAVKIIAFKATSLITIWKNNQLIISHILIKHIVISYQVYVCFAFKVFL